MATALFHQCRIPVSRNLHESQGRGINMTRRLVPQDSCLHSSIGVLPDNMCYMGGGGP